MTPESPAPALSFVIPARNEAGTIAAVIAGCLRLADASGHRCEVLVVDDASTDETPAQVDALVRERAEVRLLRQDRWTGIARTSHAGLLAASGDVICYIDGDGQFAPGDMPRLLSALDNADFVVGWRQQRAEGGARTLGSMAYNAATRLIGLDLHDVNCGFRVCRREVVQAVLPHVSSRSSFYFAELTWRVRHAGARVVEVPVPHRLRAAGAPSGATVPVVLGQFVDLARFVLRRRRGPR